MDKYKKRIRLLTLLQVISLYAIYFILEILGTSYKYAEAPAALNWLIVIGYLLIACIPNILGIICCVSAFSVASKESYEEPIDPKSTLISTFFVRKMTLIGWFIMNGIIWLMLVAGLGNPFLFWSIPLAMFIGFCATYIYTLMVNLPKFIYVVVRLMKRKKKPTASIIVALIFQFFFCLDYVGDFLLRKENLKGNI